MERDFLVAMALREQLIDASNNSVSASGMQWSYSNKVSAVPQLLSFKAAQDNKQRKFVVDPNTTPNITHMPYSSSPIQKNVVVPDKKAGNQYAMAVYPFQNAEAISVHRSQDVKMFPISNQPSNAVPLAFNVPVFQSQLVSSGQPLVGSNVNLQQPFGGVPIATSISVPFTGSVVGSTELRNASKPPGSMTQLTILYAGSVCVYNDISPEKAQAIMLLAGSGGLPQTKNENLQGVPLLSLSSPHCNAGVGSCSNIELTSAAKPTQPPASHPNHSGPRPITPILPLGPTFVPAAVPQARKASLVRFLEKRKERINTCPYSVGKKASDCSSTTLDLMA